MHYMWYPMHHLCVLQHPSITYQHQHVCASHQDLIGMDHVDVIMRPSIRQYGGWYDQCMQEAAIQGIWYPHTTQLMVCGACMWGIVC